MTAAIAKGHHCIDTPRPLQVVTRQWVPKFRFVFQLTDCRKLTNISSKKRRPKSASAIRTG